MELPTPHPRRRASMDEIWSSKGVIKELEGAIENLEARIQKMNFELQQLQQRKANYESYIAPFRQLPDEILREIVDQCLRSNISLRTLLYVCGSLRDIILGMSSVWSNISLGMIPIGHAIEYWRGIPCDSSKYLKLLLDRAGSTALKLRIARIVNPEVFEPIISRSCIIQSLELSSFYGGTFYYAPDFPSFDFRSLNHLHLDDVELGMTKQIMDLALQSSSESFNLILTGYTMSLLAHDLVQRAVELNFSTALDSLPDQNTIEITPLPRAMTCVFKCNPLYLPLLDLRNTRIAPGSAHPNGAS
ncbi:hypothetical protein CPB86DRAFT_57392 [Serendipita vermifera]|nr:hypothetical protein CPB86DRAFT_57392 [Serendipita vermifera]